MTARISPRRVGVLQVLRRAKSVQHEVGDKLGGLQALGSSACRATRGRSPFLPVDQIATVEDLGLESAKPHCCNFFETGGHLVGRESVAETGNEHRPAKRR